MKTLQEVLLDAKEVTGLDTAAIQKISKLSPEAIAAIEQGRWDFFHSPAYCRGAVLRYAAVVQVPSEKAEALFHRDIERGDTQFVHTTTYTRKRMRIFSWVIVGGALLVLLLGAVHFSLYLTPPPLQLGPIATQIHHDTPIAISGTTQPGSLVYLNIDRIPVNTQGQFFLSLYLQKGTQNLEVKVIGTNGRETKKTIRIAVD